MQLPRHNIVLTRKNAGIDQHPDRPIVIWTWPSALMTVCGKNMEHEPIAEDLVFSSNAFLGESHGVLGIHVQGDTRSDVIGFEWRDIRPERIKPDGEPDWFSKQELEGIFMPLALQATNRRLAHYGILEKHIRAILYQHICREYSADGRGIREITDRMRDSNLTDSPCTAIFRYQEQAKPHLGSVERKIKSAMGKLFPFPEPRTIAEIAQTIPVIERIEDEEEHSISQRRDVDHEISLARYLQPYILIDVNEDWLKDQPVSERERGDMRTSLEDSRCWNRSVMYPSCRVYTISIAESVWNDGSIVAEDSEA